MAELKFPFRSLLANAYYSGIGKSAVIYPVAFIGSIGMSILSLGFIFFLQDKFGATGEQIGFFTGFWAAGYLAGFFYLRHFLHKAMLPRYQILVSSLVIALTGFILLVLPSMNYIYISQVVYGGAVSLFWPPLTAWLSMGFEGKKLGGMMSRYNISWCSGTVIGPLAGGFICELSPVAAIVTGASLFICNAMLLAGAILTMRHGGDVEAHGEGGPRGGVVNYRVPALAGLLCCFVFIGIVVSIFPVYARNELHLSEMQIGFLLFSRTLAMTCCFIVLGRFTEWHNRAWPMLVPLVLMAMLMPVLSAASYLPGISGLFLALGLLNAIIYAGGQYHSVAGSRSKTFGAAISELLITIGLGVGSVAGGMVYQFLGFQTVMTCLAFLMAAVWLLQILTVLSARKAASASRKH